MKLISYNPDTSLNCIYLTLITKHPVNKISYLGTEKSILLNFAEKCIKSIRQLGKYKDAILLFTDIQENEKKRFYEYNVGIIDVDKTEMGKINYAPTFAKIL